MTVDQILVFREWGFVTEDPLMGVFVSPALVGFLRERDHARSAARWVKQSIHTNSF